MGLKWKEKKEKISTLGELRKVNEVNGVCAVERRKRERTPVFIQMIVILIFQSCAMFENCSWSRITFKFNFHRRNFTIASILGKFQATRVSEYLHHAAHSAECVFQKCLKTRVRGLRRFWTREKRQTQPRRKITSKVTATRYVAIRVVQCC